jgi:hypothetical protein
VVRRHEGSPNRGLDFLFLAFFYLATTEREGPIRVGHTFVPVRREGLRGQELRAARGLRRDGRAAEKEKIVDVTSNN